MKTLRFYFVVNLILIFTTYSQSQIIPNGDFESWTNKILFEEPLLYLTSNGQAYSQMSNIPVTKSTDKVSGNYSAKIETVAGQGGPIPGFLIIGSPGNQTVKGGLPLSGHPDSISFYAKFDEMPGDTGAFVTFFKRNDTMLAMSRFTFIGTQSTFKKYTVPVFWFRSGNADTMAVIITSSNFDWEKKVGSKVYIDSIKFIGYSGLFPNGNFENWKSQSSNEPDNWSSLNFMVSGKPMVTKSTDKYSGSFAIQIENVQMNFGEIMGFVTNGRIFESDYPTGGLAVNQNPLKVSGYYKYMPNGPDTAIGGIFLYRWDNIGDSLILIEDTIIKLTATNTYTYFEIPILYDGKPKADTINIAFAVSNIDIDSSYRGLGSTLLIDKLWIDYKPNKINNKKVENLKVYPNPSNQKITIELPEFNKNYTEMQLEIFELNGKLKYKTEFLSKSIEITKENLCSGMYFYKIKTKDEREIGIGKLVFE